MRANHLYLRRIKNVIWLWKSANGLKFIQINALPDA